ncbi:uncharacterized protein LOC123319972 [Coccinella septempunctata]|uniref:uncharacterized protein LOC123319972 n=1 Tax=Coccinella septempunctata TaxID=41139 RepID=UPI001D079985|nr:uncharacterized protein LOC123319972 [Coccinella septempunctata]
MPLPSDSSDDENLDRFKEATDTTFFKNSLYSGMIASLKTKLRKDLPCEIKMMAMISSDCSMSLRSFRST